VGDPPIQSCANVGLTGDAASKIHGDKIRLAPWPRSIMRTIAPRPSASRGLIKVVADKSGNASRRRVSSGPRAGELLLTWSLAITQKSSSCATLRGLDAPYPNRSEVSKRGREQLPTLPFLCLFPSSPLSFTPSSHTLIISYTQRPAFLSAYRRIVRSCRFRLNVAMTPAAPIARPDYAYRPRLRALTAVFVMCERRCLNIIARRRFRAIRLDWMLRSHRHAQSRCPVARGDAGPTCLQRKENSRRGGESRKRSERVFYLDLASYEPLHKFLDKRHSSPSGTVRRVLAAYGPAEARPRPTPRSICAAPEWCDESPMTTVYAVR